MAQTWGQVLPFASKRKTCPMFFLGISGISEVKFTLAISQEVRTVYRSLVAIAAAISLLIACATAHKISNVRLGMTKDEVVAVMGQPTSTSAQGGYEYLNYALSETDDHAFYGVTTPYYVRLVSGLVESFGRSGDFDSTKTPTIRVETDEKIKQDVNLKGTSDLYTELKKLKELKDSGIITEAEFQAQKQKLLQKY